MLRRLRPGTLVIAIMISLLVDCDHSVPATLPAYGAVGLLFPGPEARLNGAGPTAAWTEDGSGVLNLGICLTNQSAYGPVEAPAFTLFPVGGGSAVWQLCETDLTIYHQIDSTPRFHTGALGADGRFIYTESVQWKTPGSGQQLPFPLAAPTALWLTDSAVPFTRRRKVMSLYRDTLGVATVPADSINWLANIAWAGETTFVAFGQNITPAGVITNFGVVRGEIGADGATLHRVAGAEHALIFAMAEGNATVVLNRNPLTVERTPLTGGAATLVAVLPQAPGRVIAGLSCRASFCLILSQEAGSYGTQSTLWGVHLDTGIMNLVGGFPFPVGSALISPASNTVLIARGNDSYLYRDIPLP